MVNCKGIATSSKPLVNQEICRYCRTRVCEECFVAATGRKSVQSEFVTPVRHQHVCLACTRLHPEAKELRSPPRERRQSRLPRLNSAPISGGPRIDSLSSMAREYSTWSRNDKPSAAEDQQVEARQQSPKKPTDKKLTTGDLRRRRHTSAIAPTSQSVDFSHSRQSRARHLLRANATELQAARRQANVTELHTSRKHELEAPTSYSYDFTCTTARMAIRDATSTEPKGLELTMVDLRDVPKAQSCDLTGTKPLLDVSKDNELELSTVDLRLSKYKVNVPAPTKRRRRASAADPINSALTPISIENLAAIDAKLSSVELELKRYDVAPKNKATSKSKVELPKTPSSISSGGSSSSTTKKGAEPIDFHLSTVDLRPRPCRHTTTDTKSKVSQHGNQESVVEEVEFQGCGGFAPFQRKKSPEPIDFHLSTFDLKPRKVKTDPKPESNQVEIGRHKSRSKKEKVKAVPATPEQTTPKYSKNEPCDLAYLENFRSYTL